MSDNSPSQSINRENEVANRQLDLANAYLPIAQSADKRSAELYDLTKPGLNMAEGYYQKLASGDPLELQKAIAPATEKIIANSEAVKKNISDNTPRGGEQRLAMEQADIAKSSKIGDLSTQAYTGAFPALASLAGTGIGLSMNEISAALSALGGSGSSLAGAAGTFGNVANQQEQGKASTMQLFGALAGAAGTGAGLAAGCWVAEELFGVNDRRTHLLRFWLNRFYNKTAFGSAFMWMYLRHGRRAVRVIRMCKFARAFAEWIFQRLFDRAWKECDGQFIMWVM